MHRIVAIAIPLFLLADCSPATADVAWESGILVSPDGKLLAFPIIHDERTDIMLCNADGTELRFVASTPDECDTVLWLDNGTVAATAFAGDTRYRVFTTRGEPLPEVALPSGCDPIYKRLSPDHRMVAFAGSNEEDGEKTHGLFIADPNALTVHPYLIGAFKTAPAWSPDSRRIAIGNGEGYVARHDLLILDVASGAVTNTQIEGAGADWSRDGRQLAFTSGVQAPGTWHHGIPASGHIARLEIASGAFEPLTPEGTFNKRADGVFVESTGAFMPLWSPDGRWVAFTQYSQFHPDGESERQRTIETVIANVDSRKGRVVHEGECRYVWAPEVGALYVLESTAILRVDPRTFNSSTIVSW